MRVLWILFLVGCCQARVIDRRHPSDEFENNDVDKSPESSERRVDNPLDRSKSLQANPNTENINGLEVIELDGQSPIKVHYTECGIVLKEVAVLEPVNSDKGEYILKRYLVEKETGKPASGQCVDELQKTLDKEDAERPPFKLAKRSSGGVAPLPPVEPGPQYTQQRDYVREYPGDYYQQIKQNPLPPARPYPYEYNLPSYPANRKRCLYNRRIPPVPTVPGVIVPYVQKRGGRCKSRQIPICSEDKPWTNAPNCRMPPKPLPTPCESCRELRAPADEVVLPPVILPPAPVRSKCRSKNIPMPLRARCKFRTQLSALPPANYGQDLSGLPPANYGQGPSYEIYHPHNHVRENTEIELQRAKKETGGQRKKLELVPALPVYRF